LMSDKTVNFSIEMKVRALPRTAYVRLNGLPLPTSRMSSEI
jgi:hypothetical protein